MTASSACKKVAAEIKSRFGVEVDAADGSTDAGRKAARGVAEVILSAARAGVQVISRAQLAARREPAHRRRRQRRAAGRHRGLAVNANGEPLEATKAVGIGPLAIGNVKYKTEFGLFKKMIEAEKTVAFDFQDAFSLAREIAK